MKWDWTNGWELMLFIAAILTIVVTAIIYWRNKVQKRRNFFYKRVVDLNETCNDIIDNVMEISIAKSAIIADNEIKLISNRGKGNTEARETVVFLEKANTAAESNLIARKQNYLVSLELKFFMSALSPDMIKLNNNGSIKRIKYNFFKTVKINGNRVNRGKVIVNCLNELIKIFTNVRTKHYGVDLNFYIGIVQNLLTEILNVTNGYVQLPYDIESRVDVPEIK